MDYYGVSDEIFNIQYDLIEYFVNEKQDEIKNYLVNIIKDKEGAVNLFLDCRKECKPNSIKHNKLVDRYFMGERIVTKARQSLSILDFLKDARNLIENNPVLKKTFAYSLLHKNSIELSPIFCVFRIYYGSLCGFKPCNAIELYKKYNPKHIIDPCAGWGGRLIGAMALDINYTGIDVNTYLKNNYDELLSELGEHSKSKVVMKFEDSLNTNISEIDYDMVFTSPPYFNIEKYRCSEVKSKEEWLLFYKTLFLKYWNGLKLGGVFAINVNDEIYKKSLLPLLGECEVSHNLKMKLKNGKETKYKELIYIWIKKC